MNTSKFSKQNTVRLSRRSFLRRSTLASASLATLGGGLAVTPFARVLGANDAVRLAVVGIGSSVKIGGKGKQDIRDFRKIPGVRIVALCDVDRAHLDPQMEQFKKWNEKVEAYTDVRRLLENREIDAVTITTPNHWHALVAVWACQAGKDVFVQKPASHNIFEGRQMVAAARKYGRIVLCTSASRDASGFREAHGLRQRSPAPPNAMAPPIRGPAHGCAIPLMAAASAPPARALGRAPGAGVNPGRDGDVNGLDTQGSVEARSRRAGGRNQEIRQEEREEVEADDDASGRAEAGHGARGRRGRPRWIGHAVRPLRGGCCCGATVIRDRRGEGGLELHFWLICI